MKPGNKLRGSAILRSVEASLFDGRITLSERVGMFFISAVAMFVTLLVVYFMGTMVFDIFLAAFIERWFWMAAAAISLGAGILGFMLGSDKMTEVFGYLWRTNGKWE